MYSFILIVFGMQYLVFWILDSGYFSLGNSVFSVTSKVGLLGLSSKYSLHLPLVAATSGDGPYVE